MSVATVGSVKLVHIPSSTTLQNNESWMELDMHADTTVLGKSCLLIQDFKKNVSVSGWNASVVSTKCPTVTGVVAFTTRIQALLHACLAPSNILGVDGTSPCMPDAVLSEWSGGD